MARSNFVTAIASNIAAGFKASVPVTSAPARSVSRGTWWGSIRESFSGAWQAGVTVDSTSALLAHQAVYACLTLISNDIAKLRPKLMQFDRGVWQETSNPAFSPVLRKPNRYQTRIQFLSAWVNSKLIYGNTYVLKERDARQVVIGLHVLDPSSVTVLLTSDGGVYYSLKRDDLSGVAGIGTTVPATEIIHDRADCLFHPMVGIGPIFACGLSATQGNRIQANSAKFFENMSRPSGMITAPETISDETAKRLKADFETNFSGANIGRLLVMGDGLKYEAMTIPPQQAQLIEQLRWTVEAVASCFHVPLHKIGAATNVKFSNMAEMNQDYYSQTLQSLIESIELLLDEGLGLTGGPQQLGVEVDLEGLLRMDPVQRAQRNEINVKAGIWSPDEARATDNMPPVKGGSEPFLQQQNFPLSVLAQQPPPGSMPPAPPPALPPPADPLASAAAKVARDLIEASAAADTRMHGYVEAMKAMADAAVQREVDAQASHAAMLSAVKSIGDSLAQKPAAPDEESDVDEVQELAAALIAKFSAAEHVA